MINLICFFFFCSVPPPTNLRIEKILSNSVLISWNPPLTDMKLLGYQVLVDQTLYTTIHMNERSRALIENLNLNEKTHRIAIRSITQQGLSRDQQCTLLVTNSKELSYMPTDLRVGRITQTTAVVSWWPASNDLVHKLYVNDIEVQTLKAGIYRFKLSGLLPNTVHKVTIQGKPTNLPSPHAQQSACSIEFRTNPFGILWFRFCFFVVVRWDKTFQIRLKFFTQQLNVSLEQIFELWFRTKIVSKELFVLLNRCFLYRRNSSTSKTNPSSSRSSSQHSPRLLGTLAIDKSRSWIPSADRWSTSSGC